MSLFFSVIHGRQSQCATVILPDQGWVNEIMAKRPIHLHNKEVSIFRQIPQNCHLCHQITYGLKVVFKFNVKRYMHQSIHLIYVDVFKQENVHFQLVVIRNIFDVFNQSHAKMHTVGTEMINNQKQDQHDDLLQIREKYFFE